VPGGERVVQCGSIDDRAARDVHQQAFAGIAASAAASIKVPRLFTERDREDDDVALGERVVQTRAGEHFVGPRIGFPARDTRRSVRERRRRSATEPPIEPKPTIATVRSSSDRKLFIMAGEFQSH